MADDPAAERPVPSRRRTAVAYIDGFNFYYGAVRHHPDLKWVDLEVLCERLLGRGHELLGVTYCTARVSATVTDPRAPERQHRYLRALSGLSRTKVLTGTFMTKTITRPIARGPRKGKRVEVVTWEEKGSDVNVATELVLDTCDHRMTTAPIISNDSDLQHTVDVVRVSASTGERSSTVRPRSPASRTSCSRCSRSAAPTSMPRWPESLRLRGPRGPGAVTV
jgi:hypothetical protein